MLENPGMYVEESCGVCRDITVITYYYYYYYYYHYSSFASLVYALI